MARRNVLTQSNLTLLAIFDNGNNASVKDIYVEIKARGKELSLPQIHTLLYKLRKDGMIDSAGYGRYTVNQSGLGVVREVLANMDTDESVQEVKEANTAARESRVPMFAMTAADDVVEIEPAEPKVHPAAPVAIDWQKRHTDFLEEMVHQLISVLKKPQS